MAFLYHPAEDSASREFIAGSGRAVDGVGYFVVLSAAKDLIAACQTCSFELLTMRSFASLRMT